MLLADGCVGLYFDGLPLRQPIATAALALRNILCPPRSMQITGGDNTDFGTIATVVGGLVGVAILGYLGLQL